MSHVTIFLAPCRMSHEMAMSSMAMLEVKGHIVWGGGGSGHVDLSLKN